MGKDIRDETNKQYIKARQLHEEELKEETKLKEEAEKEYQRRKRAMSAGVHHEEQEVKKPKRLMSAEKYEDVKFYRRLDRKELIEHYRLNPSMIFPPETTDGDDTKDESPHKTKKVNKIPQI